MELEYRVKFVSLQYSSHKIIQQLLDIFFRIKTMFNEINLLQSKIAAFLLIFFIAFTPSYVMAKGKSSADNGVNKKYASIVVDSDSGMVISEKNADKKLHPASLTKVMTLILLFESMESGNTRLNDRILISPKAAAQQPSKIGLKAGSSMRVEDAILSLVTKSANDISVAIAEHLAGSESRFAERMTNRARSIGMASTTFKNASGLHNPAQITTARDMATMAKYLISRYPTYYRYFGTKQFTYRGVTYTNHNKLMNSFAGMDGLKTGYIVASGFNLIASAKRGNSRIIGVVFGGRSWKTRNDHMAELLSKGFSNLKDLRLVQKSASPTSITAATSPPPILNANPVTPPPVKKAAQDVVPKINVQNYSPSQTLKLPESYTSLSSLDSKRKIAIPTNPAPDQNQVVLESVGGDWSIQIGAYASRMTTDDALRIAQSRLPANLSHASRLVVPLETSNGFLYRARLGGLNQNQAIEACQYFRDCLPIAP